MQIKEWQKEVDHWIKKYGVRYFDVTTNTLILSEEIGEFSSLIARVYGEQSFKNALSEDEINNRLKEEIGDIFFVLTCLSNQLNFNITEILGKNLEKKTNRDSYRHLENKKLKQ